MCNGQENSSCIKEVSIMIKTIKQYTHYPNQTEAGLGNTNDSYLRIPSEYASMVSNMLPQNKDVTFIDESTGEKYPLKAVLNSHELRINQLGDYYKKHQFKIGDSIVLTVLIDDKNQHYNFIKSIKRNGITFLYASKTEGFVIFNSDLLIGFTEKNVNDFTVKGVNFNSQFFDLTIKYKGAQYKRNDSPSATDFYDVSLTGSQFGLSKKNGDTFFLDVDSNILESINVHEYNEVHFPEFNNLNINAISSNSQSGEKQTNEQIINISQFAHQVIYYGAPGTGKSFAVNKLLKDYYHIRTTFFPDSDYSSFVGSYKPCSRNGQIEYCFVAQSFIKAYIESWRLFVSKYANNQSVNEYEVYPVFLVIEEINRGNCAQIFGDLFQLLDRNDYGFSSYPIECNQDIQIYLEDKFSSVDFASLSNANSKIPILNDVFLLQELKAGRKMLLPNNLFIYATMNTSDQSLFPMDSAFKRRWDWKYVPISQGYDTDNQSYMKWKIEVNNKTYFWWDFITKINEKIGLLTSSEDKKIGFFFCKPDIRGIISEEKFVGKVLFYLWNELFKDYGIDNQIANNVTYDMFYSDVNGNVVINTNLVKEFLDRLLPSYNQSNRSSLVTNSANTIPIGQNSGTVSGGGTTGELNAANVSDSVQNNSNVIQSDLNNESDGLENEDDSYSNSSNNSSIVADSQTDSNSHISHSDRLVADVSVSYNNNISKCTNLEDENNN